MKEIVGACEEAIFDAMLKGFNDGGREFTVEDIIDALKEIVPISTSPDLVIVDSDIAI